MATLYSTEMAGVASTPPVKPNLPYAGRVRCFKASIPLASQAAADVTVLADIPAGYAFAYGILTTDTSLGSTTIQIGDSSDTDRLRADGTFTATNTPTFFGRVGSGLGISEGLLSAQRRVTLTWSTATAPSSGNLIVQLFYVGG